MNGQKAFGNAGDIKVGQWSFVGVRFDGGKVDVFINGAHYRDHNKWNGTAGMSGGGADSPVTLGNTKHEETPFTGSIAEFAIFNEAVNAGYMQL